MSVLDTSRGKSRDRHCPNRVVVVPLALSGVGTDLLHYGCKGVLAYVRVAETIQDRGGGGGGVMHVLVSGIGDRNRDGDAPAVF